MGNNAVKNSSNKLNITKHCMTKNEILGWKIAFILAIIWCAYFCYQNMLH